MCAPREKSILLRGLRKRKIPGSMDEITEAWFLIKLSRKGILATEIFQNLPSDPPLTKKKSKNNNHRNAEYYFLSESSCVQINSSLYVLGGRDHIYLESFSNTSFSNTVRLLDIKNPDRWKACKPLPYHCGSAQVCAGGNLIYLFPRVGPDLPDNLPGGFVYDTLSTNGSKLVPPLCYKNDKGLWHPVIYFCHDFGNGCNGASITTPDSLKQVITFCPGSKRWFTHEKLELSKLDPMAINSAFLNGILYISDWYYWRNFQTSSVKSVLRAYDVRTDDCLLGDGIALPEFRRLYRLDDAGMDMNFVAVADFKLCYLWSERKFSGVCSSVFIVTVVVSCDRLSASVFEEEIELNVYEIWNCIPFDLYGESYSEDEEEELRGSELEQNEMKEGFLQKCENRLLDEVRRLREEKQRLMEEKKKLVDMFDSYGEIYMTQDEEDELRRIELEQNEKGTPSPRKCDNRLLDEVRRLREEKQRLMEQKKKLVDLFLSSCSNYARRNRAPTYFIVGQIKVPFV